MARHHDGRCHHRLHRAHESSGRRAAAPSFPKCYTGGAPVAPAVVAQSSGASAPTSTISTASPRARRPPTSRRWAGGPRRWGGGALSIGRPIPAGGQDFGLADPDLETAGEPGELALRGPFLFAGYWNKPDETTRAFHDGFFLTGDIAVMDPQGWFYLVDRKKDMIVASGFKVWPREVEDMLYQHPAVREAAVIGVPDPYRGETVKAFVALRGHEADPDEMIAFCRDRMSAYNYRGRWSSWRNCPRRPPGSL